MTDDIQKWKDRLYPKLSINLSPDQIREYFEHAKHSLVRFAELHLHTPIEDIRRSRVVSDDVEDRSTATGMMQLIREGSRRFHESFLETEMRDYPFRGLDINEETLGYDDDELEVTVTLKKLNNGHVLIKAGCQERVVHTLEELYSMLRALIRTNIPEGLFLRGGKE